jgi:hypothetical protein
MEEWIQKATAELDRAKEARQAGKEGMARVCARRAAGIIAAQYLRGDGIDLRDPSAYHCLQVLQGMPGLTVDLHQSIDALLLRVNTDHRLPPNIDLIEEVRRLSRSLMGIELE